VALVAAASALAWPSDSPLEPRNAGHPSGDSAFAWWFLALLVLAFVLYVAAVLVIRRASPRLIAVGVIAAAVQLVPLGAPLLLSTDAWTYWDYARIATVHDGNPYADTPAMYPDDPAFAWVGEDWRDTSSVYGPGFTLASLPVASIHSHDAAAWFFKVLSALAVLVAAMLAARLSPRPALAFAFAGWNPLLAVHFAGGGHNDAWIAALVLAALAAAAAGRRQLAGACWALAALVKWVPLLLLPIRATEARATGRRVGHIGFAATALVVAVVATVWWGFEWLHAFVALAHNANQETSFALPHRLEQLGVPDVVAGVVFAAAFVVGYLVLWRRARAGRARLALVMILALAVTPYIAPWYTVWAVPLAAAEDDEPAGLLSLAFCAYLLRQTIPL
jgi:hypothetical protein